jgi:hypothetical protein
VAKAVRESKPGREPNIKDKTETGKISQRLSDFLTELRASIVQDNSDRQNWLAKMVIATNQRLGVKRWKNTPYPGAPDIPLPETDKLIRKGVPNLVLSAWAPKKKCLVRVRGGVQVTEILKEKAKRTEMAMNWLLSNKMGLYKKLLMAADYAKEKGHCIFKVIEEFSSRMVHKVINLDELEEGVEEQLKALPREQKELFVADRYGLDLDDDDDEEVVDDVIDQFTSGERVIEFDVEEIESLPNIVVPLPTKIIVPSYTTDIAKATRLTYEYFRPRQWIEEQMDKGVFLKKDIDDLDLSGIPKGGDKDIVEQQKKRNEGVTDNASHKDLYRIHEVETWWKPKKTGRAEKWVFTFFADVYDAEEALLQRIPFPFEFKYWNYDKYDDEVKDPGYYSSRGLPERMRAVQEVMERSVNNMLIRDEMNNTPIWEVLDSSELMDAQMRFAPGDKLGVGQIGAEIKRLNEPTTVDLSSERIMQLLKATVEEYLGSTDQLFRNATNVGGGKTLGEIKEGIRQSSGPLNLEVINFNETLTRVYQKVFSVMAERLGGSIFINNVEITKEDFNFPAEVKSNGSLEVSDKLLATQKAFNRLQVIAQFMQAGVVNQEDVFNALQDWLEKDGVKDPDQFSTDPKIILQGQLAQLQQAVGQLQQQAQMLQQANEKGQKDVAKVKEQGRKAVKQTQGKLEANAGG